MQIRIDEHTIERAQERGTSSEEIIDVINTGVPINAKHNRQGKAKVFPFHKERNGKYYDEKRVEVFYIIEQNTITTVTVYVFCGAWGQKQ